MTDEMRIDFIVAERINELSSEPFEELSSRPSLESNEIDVEGRRVILSVWHDVVPSGEHRIVVQAYVPGILGIGRMCARGFTFGRHRSLRIR